MYSSVEISHKYYFGILMSLQIFIYQLHIYIYIYAILVMSETFPKYLLIDISQLL